VLDYQHTADVQRVDGDALTARARLCAAPAALLIQIAHLDIALAVSCPLEARMRAALVTSTRDHRADPVPAQVGPVRR
jgi:hypothetical protein